MLKFTKIWLIGVGIALFGLTAVCGGSIDRPAAAQVMSVHLTPDDRQVVVRIMEIAGHQVSLIRMIHQAHYGTAYEYCFGVTEGSVALWPQSLCQ